MPTAIHRAAGAPARVASILDPAGEECPHWAGQHPGRRSATIVWRLRADKPPGNAVRMGRLGCALCGRWPAAADRCLGAGSRRAGLLGGLGAGIGLVKEGAEEWEGEGRVWDSEGGRHPIAVRPAP